MINDIMIVITLQINLRYGINTPKARVGHETDTCTACAGTMIMEFGALSRLTGKPIYEVGRERIFVNLNTGCDTACKILAHDVFPYECPNMSEILTECWTMLHD